MSERWLLANRAFFVRDLVRDYCMVFRLLSDQRRRFVVQHGQYCHWPRLV